MTLNEGLKAISMDHAHLILTHVTWPKNRYIQMSCPTTKIGNIDGIMSGPMSVKVISTIEDNVYTEESFSRKNFKDEVFNDGWIILDNDAFAKRLMSCNRDNRPTGMELDNEDIVDMAFGKNNIKVSISEPEKELLAKKFSTERHVIDITESLKGMFIPEKVLKSYLDKIDNSDLPFELSVQFYKDSVIGWVKHKLDTDYILADGIESAFINTVLRKFNEVFPDMFGLSKEDLEFAKQLESTAGIDLNLEDLNGFPRATAKKLLNDRILNSSLLKEHKPEKKPLKLIFKKKK